MEIKVKSYSQQSSLISSILFFILGACFLNAEDIAEKIIFGIGIFLAVMAVIEFVIYFLQRKNNPENKPKLTGLIYAIITLVFAIIFIFFYSVVEQFIRFIIGFWVLFSGIIRLINALSYSPKNKKFIPLLIVSLLLIAVGIYTIVKDNIILHTAGIIMMIYAVIEIIGFIVYTKDSAESVDPGSETLIIPENDKKLEKVKKTKKIKDVQEDKEK